MRSCMGSFLNPKSVQARLRLEKLKLDLVLKRIMRPVSWDCSEIVNFGYGTIVYLSSAL